MATINERVGILETKMDDLEEDSAAMKKVIIDHDRFIAEKRGSLSVLIFVAALGGNAIMAIFSFIMNHFIT